MTILTRRSLGCRGKDKTLSAVQFRGAHNPWFMRIARQQWFCALFRIFAYLVVKPPQWLLHRTPLATPSYNLFGRITDLRIAKGKSFGQYVPDAHDVIVCSYGKSGTNWTLQIAHQIAHLGEGEYEHIHCVVPWPDELARGFSISLDDPAPKKNSPTGMRVIKTHLPWDCVPYSAGAKYVCVVRDPKDVAVSGYHFFRAVLLGPLMPPVGIWVEHFLNGKNLLGSWAWHLNGYWRERHRDNVLFLRFEEMKKDLPGTIDQIAALMDVALTPEQRAKVVAQSEFSHMREIDHKFYPGQVTPLSQPEGKMMRAGTSGTAHHLLNEAQLKRIDEVCRAELLKLDCDFPYDAYYGAASEA